MKQLVPVFHATVDPEARVVFEPAEQQQRAQHLRTLRGCRIEVVIRQQRKRRSLDQNAWLWGKALPVIADALGYDEHEHELLHYALLGECYGTVYDQRFGREIPRQTSSKRTTKEFSDYMEWIVRWAATEHGIIVPLPGESEAA